LAHAPRSDPHDGIDLSSDVAHAVDVALPVDGGRTRLQHGVADAYGAGVMRKLLELTARGNVEPAWRCHGGHGTSDSRPGRVPPRTKNRQRRDRPLPQSAKTTISGGCGMRCPAGARPSSTSPYRSSAAPMRSSS